MTSNEPESSSTMDIVFRNTAEVELVQSVGDDDSVVRAMLVSTLKDQAPELHATPGRIAFLMRNRHGTPFEHNSWTFRVSAPIFVFREWHRHRIGVSYHEQSGRYTQFLPVFYVPPSHRPLIQVGKPGDYHYEPGSPEQYARLVHDMETQALYQWVSYQNRLADGIALEVARMSLGVNIFSSMYFTCNARSLMAFLGLRTAKPPYWVEGEPDHGDGASTFYVNEGGAMFPSRPMFEIAEAADTIEAMFAQAFPLTYEAWVQHGRVAP